MIWLLGGYMWLFVHRPFEYWPSLGALQVERAYMIMMILFWLVWPGKGLASSRIHLAIAGFSFATLLCWWFSPYADEGAFLMENYFKVLVFYVLVVTSVRSERDLRRLIALYLLAVALFMGHSMLEWLNGRYEYRQGIRRMIGVSVTLGDPNAFALTALLSLPMLLPFWAEARSRGRRLLLLGYFGLASTCILLTGSRTSFVGLVAFGLACALLSRRRAVALTLAAVVGLGMVVTLEERMQNRLLSIIDSSYSRAGREGETSAEGRLKGFLIGVQLWQANFVFGVGPAGFQPASGVGFQAHNIYGQVTAEMGTAGVVSFSALLCCYFGLWRWGRKVTRRLPPGQGAFPFRLVGAVVLTVLLLLLTGWACHSLFRYNWVWLAAFQGCAAHCLACRALQARRVALRPAAHAPRPRPVLRLVGI